MFCLVCFQLKEQSRLLVELAEEHSGDEATAVTNADKGELERVHQEMAKVLQTMIATNSQIGKHLKGKTSPASPSTAGKGLSSPSNKVISIADISFRMRKVRGESFPPLLTSTAHPFLSPHTLTIEENSEI